MSDDQRTPTPALRWTPDLDAWARAADLVSWQQPYSAVWRPGSPHDQWFADGALNASLVCIDRWAEADPERVAIRWEGEPGDSRVLTYADLLTETRTLTRALRTLGVGVGDVVALHLGWLPETVVALLACARIGAVASVLPTPLPPDAVAARFEELEPKVLMTQDGAWRRGTVLPLKHRADEALSAVGGIEHTIVVRRTGMDVAWYEGDRWYHDLVAGVREGDRRSGDEPSTLPADHPLLLLSLASRGGNPVSVRLPTAPLLVTAAALQTYGLATGATTWAAADVSWLGAQVHGILGPLATGGTTVMFEGTLDVPTHRRAWEILDRYDVTTMLTTPSVLRTMMGWSGALEDLPALPQLRRVVVFGEPAEPELRQWAATGLTGNGNVLSVADGWGQFELGGIVRLDSPVDPHLLPDAGPAIVDADGQFVPDGQVGELVLTKGWPSMLRSTDPDDVTEQHWSRFPGMYATGDLARRDADGTIEFLGRTDEVVSLSGQLVSITEVKQVLLEHPFVAHADVIERRDARSNYLAAAIVLDPAIAPDDVAVAARDLDQSVRERLGGLARPRKLIFVDRFGDELRGDERRRALVALPLDATPEPKQITWSQVLAATPQG